MPFTSKHKLKQITMHPHEKALSDNQIAVTDLPEKTQKKISKFAVETDEDKRDALDATIFGEVEDFIEDKAAKAKAAAKEAKRAEAKKEIAEKKKINVSDAPTADAAAPAAAPKKERTMFDHIYNRK